MMNQKSEEWLPPGWTVKVKVRKSGKKDKYYYEPSSQMRFNSRAEVFRYLKTAAICYPESEESRTFKQSQNNVEVKKTLAKGLPPGWIREIRETKTANRIRRDSFYIDPVNGNVFRSIREVHRYLTSGTVSRLAYKSRDQRGIDVEFQHDDISSPAVPKKEMQAIGKARRQIIWNENLLEPREITNDEAIFPNATSVGESMPHSEPDSSHGEIGIDVHCSTLPEQSDGKNDFFELVTTPSDGPTKNESKKRQRKPKDMNLTRRASKRLAGLQAEPVLEVKTGRRARPGACEESDKQAVSSTTKSVSQCLENPDVKHGTKGIIDPSKSINTNPDSSRKDDVKQDPILKLPVEDLLADPCIAFAVKTLTGGVFDASISSELSLMPNDIDRPSNESRSLGPNEKLPSSELPVNRIGVVEKLESTLELPVGEILADPCIEFAIKTLTGEIPLDDSPDIEDYFHQLSTSKTQGSSSNALNSFGSDHFYKMNVQSQKRQVIQALEASPNINFQSCGTGLHQQKCNNFIRIKDDKA
ncbi:methyl-CpG-binding domain-containing protein 13 isoform X2 [Cucurbita pepo subsp. pepo]|uniref:methyl-CpG-binding domain-containing protein 13 isoform X2 n=1 Tax=Cucurbita pepo subsp. pepo TaxID=3664 RepID=UPI000C9D4B1A|nr:methyl-CpG-binding domain-containing protein 13 isoform X2 [Cucurbita pepo subsp. pepo]